MSKLLNRNVNTVLNVFGFSYRPKEKMNNTDFYCNSNDQSEYNNYELTEFLSVDKKPEETLDSDVESLILDLNKLGGLSSSSSLSWSDDYETETTKKVYDELRKLDRVLKGEDPIPANYDQEECQEWMEFFPSLSIFDDDKTPTNSTENLLCIGNSYRDEYDCDTIFTNEEKSTVIHNSSPKYFDKSTPLISRKRILKGQSRFINDYYFNASKPNSFDVGNYLKVSPVVQNKRKLSSKSLLNRQISRESPSALPEYSSLPHIKLETLPSLKLQKSRQQVRKKSYLESPRRNDNRLILPPINTDQFRSISAIPNENIKTLSALSINSNFKEKMNKKKHPVGPVRNPISSRRERNIVLL